MNSTYLRSPKQGTARVFQRVLSIQMRLRRQTQDLQAGCEPRASRDGYPMGVSSIRVLPRIIAWMALKCWLTGSCRKH